MKDLNLFWYLKNADLFQGLNAVDLRAVAKMLNEKICLKKEVIYTPDSETCDIFILKRGEITLYTSNNGKRLVLDVLGPGSVFGHLPITLKDPDHFAEASEESYVCSMCFRDFSKLLEKTPQLLMNLLKIFSNQIYEYQRKLQEKNLSAEEKVRKHIMLKDGIPSFGKLTHAKIAEQTGIARETVSRIISKIRRIKK